MSGIIAGRTMFMDATVFADGTVFADDTMIWRVLCLM